MAFGSQPKYVLGFNDNKKQVRFKIFSAASFSNTLSENDENTKMKS